MKKLYKVTVHTEEQLGLSGVRFLEELHVLDTENNLEIQIREIYLTAYDITITGIEYEEVTCNGYNIVIEEKKYVVVLHNCIDGTERNESKLFDTIPDESLVQSFADLYGAERATIEER